MDQDQLVERIHGLEVAQAAGETTQAAAHSGVIAMVATGSVSLIVGVFLGIVIRGAR